MYKSRNTNFKLGLPVLWTALHNSTEFFLQGENWLNDFVFLDFGLMSNDLEIRHLKWLLIHTHSRSTGEGLQLAKMCKLMFFLKKLFLIEEKIALGARGQQAPHQGWQNKQTALWKQTKWVKCWSPVTYGFNCHFRVKIWLWELSQRCDSWSNRFFLCYMWPWIIWYPWWRVFQKQHKIKMTDDVDAVAWSSFWNCVTSIKSTFQSDFDEIEQLKEEQIHCIMCSICCGKMYWQFQLPTSFGKSIIFQMIPSVIVYCHL